MSAMSMPAPVATPLTAAITGLSRSSSASGMRSMRWNSSLLRCSGVWSRRSPISTMSPPLQKALPVPVTITTFTASSVRQRSSAAVHASIISKVKAFIRSGRSSTMRAMPSSMENLRWSVMVRVIA